MKKILTIIIFVFCFLPNISAKNSNIWLDFDDEQYSADQVIHQCQTEYNLPDGSELLLSRTVEDNIGMTHYTYQQYVNGVKVEGCYLLMHVRDNVVSSVNGRLLEEENLPKESDCLSKQYIREKNIKTENAEIEPLIFEFQGVYYEAYKYYDKERFSNVYIDAHTGDVIAEISLINYASKNGTALTIYYGKKDIIYNNDGKNNILEDETRNIHTFDASAYDGIDGNTIYDYTNPSSEWYAPILKSVTITWIAQDWWYNSLTDTKPDLYIRIKKSNGTILYESKYYDDTNVPVTFDIPVRIEMNGDIRIEVLDYDGISDDSGGTKKITEIIAGTYSWNNSKTQATYTIDKASHMALDAHWGMEKVYDFYKTKFNHSSFDGKGSQIVQLVSPPFSLKEFEELGFPNNACALPLPDNFIMAYGQGDGIEMNEVVSIDAMGHEFTHLVTAANGDQNLPNYGEGGALNESFGDIIGNTIEAYAIGATDWLVARGVNLKTENNAMRSLKDPKSMNHPNTYKGKYWQSITGNPTGGKNGNDMDGVHTNCGVQNFWFFLLCEGGSGYIDDIATNESYSVKGIGMDKAVQIVYHNLMHYITSTSQYPDSREGSIKAAIDLYGKGSQEHQSVVNAWHAVGVGDKYAEEPAKPKQITCAQAVQITKNLTHNTPTSETYTVIGYITDTDGKLSKGQQIFWMADTKNGGKVFESYWGNVPEVVHVGDKVSVTGNLMLYNTTSEIKNGDVVIIEHAPQALDQITNDQSPMTNKVIRDGQILILRGERVYTVTGYEVK